MERLNHQAELLLKKVTEESDKHTVQDPLSELKLLWETLENKIISRQVNTDSVGKILAFINSKTSNSCSCHFAPFYEVAVCKQSPRCSRRVLLGLQPWK